MRSIFSMGFRAEPWRPTLGQAGVVGIISAAITAGAAAYGAYQQREIAEEMKEAAEAKAAADRAKAEAEKAKAEAEAKKAAQAIQEAQQPAADGKILGIPKEYVIYGGIGLGLVGIVGLVIALTK